MKILLSVYSCVPHRGSEPGNGWNTAYHLALRGHEVHVLTKPVGKEIIQKELKLLPQTNMHFHFIDIPEVQKFFIKGNTGVYLYYFLWQHEAYKYARKLENEIDIIHHRTFTSLHGGSELWKLSKPFLWGPVGGGQVAPSALLSLFEEKKISEIIRTFVTNHYSFFFPTAAKAVQNSDLIIAYNRETKDLLLQKKAKNVLFGLGSSLESDFIPPVCPKRNKSDKLRILWVGRIFPRKGLNLAMKALAKVKVPFELTVVGNGPWGYKIPNWISENNLDGKVNWLGQLPWSDLKKIYEENDVFFYTSLRETFGVQLLEAMAFGLPVITLDCFAARDFIPDEAGFKIEVTNLDEIINNLAHVVEQLWKEPGLREQKSLAAHKFALEYTWEKTALNYERLYEKMISEFSASSEEIKI